MNDKKDALDRLWEAIWELEKDSRPEYKKIAEDVKPHLPIVRPGHIGFLGPFE